MAARHILIAQESGPKAGFNAYIEQLRKSGLDNVRAKLAEIEAHGNKKAQFEFYCATFGKHFGTTPTKSDEVDELQAQVDALVARLATLKGETAPVVEKSKRRIGRRSSSTTSTTVSDPKINLWRPWAIKKYGIPNKVGGTFTYKSKKARKNTTHEVVRITQDGAYCKRIA